MPESRDRLPRRHEPKNRPDSVVSEGTNEIPNTSLDLVSSELKTKVLRCGPGNTCEEGGVRYAPQGYFIKRYNTYPHSAHRVVSALRNVNHVFGKDNIGHNAPLYVVEEAIIAIEGYHYRMCGDDNTYTEDGVKYAPPGYFITRFIGRDLTYKQLKAAANGLGSIEGKDQIGKPASLYPIDITLIALDKYLQRQCGSDNTYSENGVKYAPPGYFFKLYSDRKLSHSQLATALKDIEVLEGGLGKSGIVTILYRIDQALVALEQYLYRMCGSDNTYTEDGIKYAPVGFFLTLYQDQGLSRKNVRSALSGVVYLSDGKEQSGKSARLYHYDHAIKAIDEYFSHRKCGDDNTYTEDGVKYAAPGYFLQLYKHEKLTYTKLRTIFSLLGGIMGGDKNNKRCTLYPIELALAAIDEYFSHRKCGDDNTYTEDGVKYAPQGYFVGKKIGDITFSQGRISKILKAVSSTQGKDAVGRNSALYPIERVNTAMDQYVYRLCGDDNTYTEDGVKYAAPDYFFKLYEDAELKSSVLRNIVKGVDQIADGRNNSGNHSVLYSIVQTREAMEEYYQKRCNLEGTYTEGAFVYAPISYLVQKYILRKLTKDKLKNILKTIKKIYGKEKTGRPAALYELSAASQVIDAYLATVDQSEPTITGVERVRLEKEIIEDAKAFAEGNTIDAKIFGDLLALCGSSRAADILYKLRPEYTALPLDFVHSVLGDYLGDCLAVKRPFRLDDLTEYAGYFFESSLQAGLIEVLKLDCLQFYYRERKADPDRSDRDIIYAYFDRAVAALGHLGNTDIDEAVETVSLYFNHAFAIEKPEYIVDELTPGRDFPDVNQRVNTKELEQKKRLLIADEMGLGKSASVIFAKESLGIGTALIVVPSNVIQQGSWQRYLSDQSDQGGYFKAGLAPRVLVIRNKADLASAVGNGWDYIIISQEKLNKRNMEDLRQVKFDMLVVDESHKLKAQGGKRSNVLLELAKQVEGDDKYLALLSATPAPNRIEDLAVAMKLLYPVEFGDVSPRSLAQRIIKAEDALALRGLLIQRMQMKLLEDSVEMPELEEQVDIIELSELEREIYNAIIEDDELEPTVKLPLLRLFLLNPSLFDTTPGLEGSKKNDLRERLVQELQLHDKVVVFVNSFVEGVIRGENNIIADLQLDPDIQILIIHGERTNHKLRKRIQQQFKEANGKVLLFVSGQTSDVGVDFSAGESVLFFNEPWTEYDRRQQRSRVYRPGLKRPLITRTAIVADTIEEGIHIHKEAKFRAVEKILRGIPLSEIEKHILEADNDEDTPEADVNPELGRFYFSALQRLQKMFAYLKGIGEEKFKQFLELYGKAYAEGYRIVGVRSYQANVNRFAAGLLHYFVAQREQQPADIRILDIPSGPEMLRRHSQASYANSVVSVDLNQEHFVAAQGEHAVASFTNLPYPDESFDYVNCALGLHYTAYIKKEKKYERLHALKEMNRVLKVGGRVVINEIFSLQFRDQAKLATVLDLLGFKIVTEYSGQATVGQQYQSTLITLEKITPCTTSVEELGDAVAKQDLHDGIKWKVDPKARLKDSRKILTDYTLNGRTIHCELNDGDRAILEEEQAILREGTRLRDQYHGIVAIPPAEVVSHGFIRVRPDKRYILFKPLKAGNGAVIIREAA